MGKPVEQIAVKSSADGSVEPSLFFRAGAGARPLIVSLHSWSADRNNQVDSIVPVADRLGWHALFPEFRGPNLAGNPRAPQACASPEAKQDIADAVDYLKEKSLVIHSRIYLVGHSGGGHMALMMAAYRPELWKAVIAVCPITDLSAWHRQNRKYAPHIEACCLGPPDNPERILEYSRRSPIHRAAAISRATVYILHGKHDASVPCSHSLELYRRIFEISPASKVYLEIFNGGHQQRLGRACDIFRELEEGENTGQEISG